MIISNRRQFPGEYAIASRKLVENLHDKLSGDISNLSGIIEQTSLSATAIQELIRKSFCRSNYRSF